MILDGAYDHMRPPEAPSAAHMRKRPDCLCEYDHMRPPEAPSAAHMRKRPDCLCEKRWILFQETIKTCPMWTSLQLCDPLIA